MVRCLETLCIQIYLIVASGENLPWTAYPDIGNLARWSVSSWKYGFGLDCLRDDNPETFWQYVYF
jgi:Anaphase-promoting complex, subunit 10 (APC10)